jgi:hypothetical protein
MVGSLVRVRRFVGEIVGVNTGGVEVEGICTGGEIVWVEARGFDAASFDTGVAVSPAETQPLNNRVKIDKRVKYRQYFIKHLRLYN